MVANRFILAKKGNAQLLLFKRDPFLLQTRGQFSSILAPGIVRVAPPFHGILPFHSRKKVASRRRIAFRVHEMSLPNERARADGISLFRPFAALIVCSTNPGRSNQKEGAFIPLPSLRLPPPFFSTWRTISLQLEISITSLSISKLDYSFQPH